MEECLGPVGQLVGMVVRTAVTFADTVNWMQDNMLAAQKEESMWYTGLDFERFKNELLIEARNAGCMSGRECYDHIRRKFQDEATLNNTRMNVVQTQSNAVDPKPKRRRRGHKRSVSFDFDQARTVAARTTAYNASAPTADPVHTPPPSPPPSRHCRSRPACLPPRPPPPLPSPPPPPLHLHLMLPPSLL